MWKTDDENAETITAKWKTKFDADEEHLGSIVLDEEFRLRFPMLDSPEDIPPGTTVLWGRATDLQRCTAITLPFGPHGSTSHQNEQNLFSDGALSRLIVGRSYIPDPTGAFVTEIHFIPRPNSELHILQLHEMLQPQKDIAEIKFAPSCTPEKMTFASASVAFFQPRRDALFNAELLSGELAVSAWIGGTSTHGFEDRVFQSHIGFAIRFKEPRDIESALNETSKLCSFLSFLTHQYIHPSAFSISALGEERPFRLHCRAFRTGAARDNTWVRNTLILPDDNPKDFGRALSKWYDNNDEALRGRYLYRYSFEEPNNFSTDRFLAIFQAVEGRIPKGGYQFLSQDEFGKIENLLQLALPDSPKVSAVIGKMKSNNSQSPRFILKQELPKVFAAARVEPQFDVDEFVERIYLRRNKSSHGGPHLEHETIESMLNDTLLLTAIYLMIECEYLGLESRDAVTKFQRAMRRELPFRTAA